MLYDEGFLRVSDTIKALLKTNNFYRSLFPLFLACTRKISNVFANSAIQNRKPKGTEVFGVKNFEILIPKIFKSHSESLFCV